jgi:uncharacterized protein YcnI
MTVGVPACYRGPVERQETAMRLPLFLCLFALGCSGSSPALAHAVLSPAEAPADSYLRAAIGIGHGCEGTPTLRVRVLIPEGILAVKPQPKAGWELKIRREPLAAATAADHGRSMTERVAEVTWSGKLLDENFDEFVMQVKLPDQPGQTLFFPTVQECEKGVHRWIEIPAAGKARHDYREPAPMLRLGPKRAP